MGPVPKILLRQRVAISMEGRTTRTTAGQDGGMPMAIADWHDRQHADGEILAARATSVFRSRCRP
jgi:L-lactate dehydrogenase (cytochrome)